MNKAFCSFILYMVMLALLFTPAVSCTKDDEQEKEEVIDVKKDNRELPEVYWNKSTKDLIVGMELTSLHYNTLKLTGGTIEYIPPMGTILTVGQDQVIKIKFTPNDTLRYKTLTDSCKINVLPLPVTTDYDGNEYHSVVIGQQVWMLENLKTTHYRNGDAIQNAITNKEWMNRAASYCNYNNDEANGMKYGRIYNDLAMMDPRQITPAGWHVPTTSDWNALAAHLVYKGHNYDQSTSGYQKLAKALSATTDWLPSTVEGSPGNDLTKNNSSGFTALPGGKRYGDGPFDGLGDLCVWHTKENLPSRQIYLNSSSLETYVINGGLYIRCIKDF